VIGALIGESVAPRHKKSTDPRPTACQQHGIDPRVVAWEK